MFGIDAHPNHCYVDVTVSQAVSRRDEALEFVVDLVVCIVGATADEQRRVARLPIVVVPV